MSLSTNVYNLAVRVATEAKALRTLLNGNAADNSALATTAKANLVAAINEVYAAVQNASSIDDTSAPSGTKSWSSQKTKTQIDAAVAALVNGAASDRDTLKELGDLLANDQNAVVAINSALGVRVAVDSAQSFTPAQQTQGRADIGAASDAAVGDTTTDFVAAFVAALA